MRKVLILGGSYFIGRRITEQCLEDGWEVSLLNRGSKPWTGRPVTQLTCDREDAAAMKQTLKGRTFDAVIDVSGLNQKQIEICCESLDCSVKHWLSLIHISEPTRQAEISYAVFCLKKKKRSNEKDH